MNTGRITGQAQKELTHNEGLQALEILIQPIVEGSPVSAPPTSPELGEQVLVGATPSGAFVGYSQHLATWSDAGWLFRAPVEGLQVTERLGGLPWRFDSGAWQAGVVRANEVRVGGNRVLGPQQPSISGTSGGSVVDLEARVTLSAILASLRQHGLIAS